MKQYYRDYINKRYKMNFFTGFFKVFDLNNYIHPIDPKSDFSDDYEAIKSDWRAIGNDIRTAMNKVNEEMKAHAK